MKLNEKSKLHLLRETVFANELENFYVDKHKTIYNLKGIESQSDSLKFKCFSLREQVTLKIKESVMDYSLFLLPNINRARVLVGNIVKSRTFSFLISFTIIGNFLLIIYFSYIHKEQMNSDPLVNLIDKFINAILLIEILLKSVANGFILGKKAYVDSLLGLFNVISTLLIFVDVYFAVNWSFVIYLKILRFFNIIQILWNIRSLRKNLNSLVRAINMIKYVLIINVPLIVFFSLLGFALFKNKLGYCFSDTLLYGVGINECSAKGFEWIVPGWNFDSFFNSLLTVYCYSMNDYLSNLVFSVWDSDTDSNGAVYRGFYLGAIYYYIIFGLVNLLGYTIGIGLIWSE